MASASIATQDPQPELFQLPQGFAGIRDAKGRIKRLTNKKRLFLQYYFGPAKMKAAIAAQMAGYRAPRFAGPSLREQLSEVIAEEEARLATMSCAGPRDVIRWLSDVAQDQHNVSARVRALEVLARIHGLITDKVQVSVDRTALAKAIEEQLATIKHRELPQDIVVATVETSTALTTVAK